MFEIKNESLTHTVNFDIGSAFSKGPGPRSGPLYKVCLKNTYHFKNVLKYKVKN